MRVVGERGNDRLRLRIDDLASRRPHARAVEAPGDPAGLIAYLDRLHQLRRRLRHVEHVHQAVVAVRQPEFRFVRRQRDPVARAAVPLHVALLEPGYFDVLQHLPRLQVADFEAEQVVDVDVDAGLRAVDGERPDDIRERTDLLHDGVGRRVRDAQQRRREPCEVHFFPVRAPDRVVRA
jgi:hypothetical protein